MLKTYKDDQGEVLNEEGLIRAGEAGNIASDWKRVLDLEIGERVTIGSGWAQEIWTRVS